MYLKHMIELVVFDMAGTTIEDGGQVLDAFAVALRKQQISVTAADLQSWRGASKHEVLRAFVERQFGPNALDYDWRVDQAYTDFRRALEASYARAGARAVQGAEQTFGWLKERGIKIALTTGFYRQVTDVILASVGWEAGTIDASICSDDVTQGRPAPYMIFRAMEATGVTNVRKVAKIGDTLLDLLAGQNAGAGMLVGVLSGSGTRQTLQDVDQAQIIPSVADLPGLLGSRITDF